MGSARESSTLLKLFLFVEGFAEAFCRLAVTGDNLLETEM